MVCTPVETVLEYASSAHYLPRSAMMRLSSVHHCDVGVAGLAFLQRNRERTLDRAPLRLERKPLFSVTVVSHLFVCSVCHLRLKTVACYAEGAAETPSGGILPAFDGSLMIPFSANCTLAPPRRQLRLRAFFAEPLPKQIPNTAHFLGKRLSGREGKQPCISARHRIRRWWCQKR